MELIKVKGSTPVTLVTETVPPCYKGSPNITKRSQVSGLLQANYENSVNNKREAEGKEADFKAQGLPWGEKFHETCIIMHVKKGEPRAYLRIKIQKTEKPKYFIDGREVPFADVEPYLRPRSSSSRQGTDQEVIVRNYQITPGNCTVKGISINNKQLLVEDEK